MHITKSRLTYALLSALMFVVIFTCFLYAYDYKEKHRIGKILKYPAFVTYNILQPITEIKLPNNIPIFNGGIIEDPNNSNNFLLTYRITHNDFTPQRISEAGLAYIDSNWQILKAHTLDLTSAFNTQQTIENQIIEPEDARIIQVINDLYLIYHVQQHDKRVMMIATLQYKNNEYQVSTIKPLIYPAGINLHQKNWSPFVYNDQLHFIYSTNPSTILRFDTNTETLIAASIQPFSKKIQKLWPYGKILGGTPAIYVPEYDAYLTIFHSFVQHRFGEPAWVNRIEPLWRIYYAGAYLFESKPPFKLLAITKKPLAFDGLYQNKKAFSHIIFPCGLTFTKDAYIVSSGVDDNKLMLFKIQKHDLDAKLIWVG